MFHWLFSHIPGRSILRTRRPLVPGPSARMKHYAAQSGHHYQYCYEGHRPFRSRTDSGTEFVFRFAAGRKAWSAVAVFLSETVVDDWERSHGREFSAAERYAIAKMALFQAFDERPEPAQMRQDVQVRAADLNAIVAALNIE